MTAFCRVSSNEQSLDRIVDAAGVCGPNVYLTVVGNAASNQSFEQLHVDHLSGGDVARIRTQNDEETPATSTTGCDPVAGQATVQPPLPSGVRMARWNSVRPGSFLIGADSGTLKVGSAGTSR